MESKNEIMKYIAIFILALSLYSCQEEFVPDNVDQAPDFVVEGFVEAGEGTNPVYILLTKSVPFLNEIGAEVFQELFVKGAAVDISDGDQTVRLTEICLSDLPDEIREEFAGQLGLDSDNLTVDYCIYLDVLDQLDRDFGNTYKLRIDIDGHELTAETSIPDLVPIDSIYFTEIPGDPIDSLAQMWVSIQDPAGPNFYRYFTDDGSGRITTSAFGSVTDDIFFEGESFDFPLTKASVRGADVDPAIFGFFNVGDTTTLKWCTIDEGHYEFWSTYEFNLNSQGPFANYIRVNHNIEGGIGIFGGLAVDILRPVVEKE